MHYLSQWYTIRKQSKITPIRKVSLFTRKFEIKCCIWLLFLLRILSLYNFRIFKKSDALGNLEIFRNFEIVRLDPIIGFSILSCTSLSRFDCFNQLQKWFGRCCNRTCAVSANRVRKSIRRGMENDVEENLMASNIIQGAVRSQVQYQDQVTNWESDTKIETVITSIDHRRWQLLD